MYLDESGSSDKHDIPLKSGQTCCFTIAGFLIPSDSWKKFNRDYLKLKKQFFTKEIENSSRNENTWEVKGNDLFSPRNTKSTRNQVFVEQVFKIIKRYNGTIFGKTFTKNHNDPMSAKQMYGIAMQNIARKYNTYLNNNNSKGLIIIDSRSAHKQTGKGLDYIVATEYMQYIFGNQDGRTLKNIIEAPLFADSSVVAGIQVADIIAGCLNSYYTEKYIGFSEVNNLLNYSHMTRYQEYLEKTSCIIEKHSHYTEYSYDVYKCHHPINS